MIENEQVGLLLVDCNNLGKNTTLAVRLHVKMNTYLAAILGRGLVGSNRPLRACTSQSTVFLEYAPGHGIPDITSKLCLFS